MNRLIVAFIICLLLSSCVKEACRISLYEFVLPVIISPVRDTFHIGDTITVISEFDEMVWDKTTQSEYLLQDFLFYPATSMIKIDTNPGSRDAFGDFEVITEDSFNYEATNFSDGSIFIGGQYTYDKEQGNYLLQYKIVPKRVGLYLLSQAAWLGTQGEHQSFPGKCKNIPSDVWMNVNSGSDNNIEFLQNSPDPHYNTWVLEKPEERFHRGGGYCFYVVE